MATVDILPVMMIRLQPGLQQAAASRGMSLSGADARHLYGTTRSPIHGNKIHAINLLHSVVCGRRIGAIAVVSWAHPGQFEGPHFFCFSSLRHTDASISTQVLSNVLSVL